MSALVQEALEVLAENAEFGENEGRSVAFRRAAAVLKTLPDAAQRMEDLKGLPNLGEHSLRVIKVRDLTSFLQEDLRLLEKYLHTVTQYSFTISDCCC